MGFEPMTFDTNAVLSQLSYQAINFTAASVSQITFLEKGTG